MQRWRWNRYHTNHAIDSKRRSGVYPSGGGNGDRYPGDLCADASQHVHAECSDHGCVGTDIDGSIHQLDQFGDRCRDRFQWCRHGGCGWYGYDHGYQ